MSEFTSTESEAPPPNCWQILAIKTQLLNVLPSAPPPSYWATLFDIVQLYSVDWSTTPPTLPEELLSVQPYAPPPVPNGSVYETLFDMSRQSFSVERSAAPPNSPAVLFVNQEFHTVHDHTPPPPLLPLFPDNAQLINSPW